MVPIPDSTAQANALRTGEIDLATSLNSAALTPCPGSQRQGGRRHPGVRVRPGTGPQHPRRTLQRPGGAAGRELAVDRDKLVNTVLGSTGEVANDMLGKGYDSYPEDVAQTVANKEEAKRIFAEKGITSFTIVAADMLPGMVSSAELMAQEFAEVGVQVTVDKRDPQTYYSNLEELHQAQAATAYWINRNPITEFRSQVMPDYPFNLSGFTSETIQQNLTKATATLDAAEQKKLVGEISKEIHDQGGDLIWGYQKQVAAYRAGLENFTSVQSVPWLAKATFNPVG